MEKQIITLGGKDIPLHIRRLKAAKRITLRMTPAGEGIVMTLPMRASLSRAFAFLNQKAGWVLANINADCGKIVLCEGASIPAFGQAVTIERVQGRGVTRLHENRLQVFGAPEFTARRVTDFLKKELHRQGLARAQEMAESLGAKVRSLRVASMRSRWGSCSVSGALTLNWRLVFAPPEILDYLIAHEVAHLREMNHSPQFWKQVATLYPDHKEARSWLKREGQGLYRYE
jgi:predicted metal-dependent hydrolase